MTARATASALKEARAGQAPRPGCAAYKMAALIYKNGPTNEFDLFLSVDYNTRVARRRKLIRDYTEAGWLIQRGSRIDITQLAVEHFDSLAEREAPSEIEKPMGQIAAPRQRYSAFTCPPISKRFIPNSQGYRDDIPKYSMRQGPSFHKA